MKNQFDPELRNLSAEEMNTVNGGSEFSESVFRAIGWVVGGLMAAAESTVKYQEVISEKGYHTHF